MAVSENSKGGGSLFFFCFGINAQQRDNTGVAGGGSSRWVEYDPCVRSVFLLYRSRGDNDHFLFPEPEELFHLSVLCFPLALVLCLLFPRRVSLLFHRRVLPLCSATSFRGFLGLHSSTKAFVRAWVSTCSISLMALIFLMCFPSSTFMSSGKA